MVGRSPWLLPVIVNDNADAVGDIVPVKITGTGTNSLVAQRQA
jgi:tRNA-2-methylthio-N6-dimethylallyladenosine synthase